MSPIRRHENRSTWGATRHLFIFATRDDLACLLADIEAVEPIRYILCEHLKEPPPSTIDSWRSLPRLGEAWSGEYMLQPIYLVSHAGVVPPIEPMKLSSGQTIYPVNQSTYPDSITIRPGGVYDETTLIAGDIATISNTSESSKLWKLFSAEVRRRYSWIRDNYVGPAALNLLESGNRLVWCSRQRETLDLHR